MRQPFEGMFGDTCETRLLQFLLPMFGIEFTMGELVGEVKLTRQSISKALKKFSDRGMVTIRKEGRSWLYSINEESALVKCLEDFDNALIESMIGAGEFKKIRAAHEHRDHPSPSVNVTGKAKARYPGPRDNAPCVASRSGTYLKGKERGGR